MKHKQVQMGVIKVMTHNTLTHIHTHPQEQRADRGSES